MKKANAIDFVNRAKPAKARVRLAKVVVSKPSYKKSARQAACSNAASNLSVVKAVFRAKLIPEVNPDEFRIVRMPG